MREDLTSTPEANTTVTLPCKTKVCQFDLSLVINKNVAAFDVTMQEVSVMTVCQPLHYLFHY